MIMYKPKMGEDTEMATCTESVLWANYLTWHRQSLVEGTHQLFESFRSFLKGV